MTVWPGGGGRRGAWFAHRPQESSPGNRMQSCTRMPRGTVIDQSHELPCALRNSGPPITPRILSGCEGSCLEWRAESPERHPCRCLLCGSVLSFVWFQQDRPMPQATYRDQVGSSKHGSVPCLHCVLLESMVVRPCATATRKTAHNSYRPRQSCMPGLYYTPFSIEPCQ